MTHFLWNDQLCAKVFLLYNAALGLLHAHIYNSLNYRRRLKVNIKISCIHHATTEKVVLRTQASYKNVFSST